MANRTASYASTIHGTNPQFLIEKITRTRIHESQYWKEHCTLLNSALVLEKAVDDLKFIGGTYGSNIKACPFLCLALKLLQIQPQKEIIDLYIEQEDFKYLRALGAYYLRFVGKPLEVYTKLEPLLKDYRKLRIMDRQHNFSLTFMDVFIYELLHEERVFDIMLPRLTKRFILEENREIEPYRSPLEEEGLIPFNIINYDLEHGTKDDRRHQSDRFGEDKRSHGRDNRDRRSSPEGKGRYHDHPKPSTSEKSRFRQEDIDNENAIRRMVGLKPLR